MTGDADSAGARISYSIDGAVDAPSLLLINSIGSTRELWEPQMTEFARRFRSETVIPLLMAMKDVTIARARQVLTIATADLELAGMLNVAMNAPVAEVRRVFNDAAGTVIYLAEVTYRADAIHVEMDLKP